MTRGFVALVVVALLAGCGGSSSGSSSGKACSKLLAQIRAVNHSVAHDVAHGKTSAASHDFTVAAKRIRNETASLAATNPVRAAAENLASQLDTASETVQLGGGAPPKVAPNGLQAVC